jgi:hypothetical protein
MPYEEYASYILLYVSSYYYMCVFIRRQAVAAAGHFTCLGHAALYAHATRQQPPQVPHTTQFTTQFAAVTQATTAAGVPAS